MVRFAEKERHQVFLEPEGWRTNEVYVQGMNTSLPEDVQIAMLRSIPGLERVELMRTGYAVEYDYVPSEQLTPSLEAKAGCGTFPRRADQRHVGLRGGGGAGHHGGHQRGALRAR